MWSYFSACPFGIRYESSAWRPLTFGEVDNFNIQNSKSFKKLYVGGLAHHANEKLVLIQYLNLPLDRYASVEEIYEEGFKNLDLHRVEQASNSYDAAVWLDKEFGAIVMSNRMREGFSYHVTYQIPFKGGLLLVHTFSSTTIPPSYARSMAANVIIDVELRGLPSTLDRVDWYTVFLKTATKSTSRARSTWNTARQ